MHIYGQGQQRSSAQVFRNTQLCKTRSAPSKPTACNCLALRQAARHVSQIYRQSFGLGGPTDHAVFDFRASLKRLGPLSINELEIDW